MKRSRTVYGGMDKFDLTRHEELVMAEVNGLTKNVASVLSCDMLNGLHMLYNKCKKRSAGSSASGSRNEGTDSESELSLYSDVEDAVEVRASNDTLNMKDRMLDTENNSDSRESESDDSDANDSDGELACVKFRKMFYHPSKDFELVKTFDSLEVSALSL